VIDGGMRAVDGPGARDALLAVADRPSAS
jgi:hypothetical protein